MSIRKSGNGKEGMWKEAQINSSPKRRLENVEGIEESPFKKAEAKGTRKAFQLHFQSKENFVCGSQR